ncbi:biotin--[acetyl-CoA-carboxylase] ligase [Tuwongella immobilis]|uniref:BPL/LPL catalytic domain-containing protein n=1 Tax=Tuwongella immobilis TaxID=692036 RepID=A0A6C2YT66_9BACT|nr:biotin--[acetyl-CoA-carboxylase] ligase [Tuwongella immobilis]VIP04656.1 biotin--acetyl- -carboxylase ligase : Biotin/acetyl-CoA-carboxylase ligase OS=Pedosphaera parvula (strain Ellin514) GN=Cflav_PD3240 PE=4 SV=1: BPL_LplA_LipB [Tuwongella immobilis]VTS06673.1 biotin--acetyl- -carboxylase ligase : Biotin/acetyl-CoA-carboxylase ligase OS=Pedosphaera parvula (strain Ellin514) GN=Cflav_PD3240 PE=4 SV=1: BPL_LplA_LipB [Tuwongella immobilis]
MPTPEIWTLPTRIIGREVQVYAVTDSTNDRAAMLGHDAQHDGTVVLAWNQTAGRGQYGRIWQCGERQGVLLSVLLRPPAMLRHPAILTVWAAVAVAETVQRLTGESSRIKWPNDVLVNGQKICGILLESSGSAMVAGMGLNVNQTTADFEAAGLPDATSLAMLLGRAVDPAEVARTLIDQLDREYTRLLDGEIALLEATWKARLGLMGKMVAVEKHDGIRLIGRLMELGFDGVYLDVGGSLPSLFRPEEVRQIREQRPES